MGQVRVRQSGRGRDRDPYFHQEGNGGYDVRNYDLSLAYDPDSDHLDGLARIKARATESLSSFIWLHGPEKPVAW
jgi:hypothetical protein